MVSNKRALFLLVWNMDLHHIICYQKLFGPCLISLCLIWYEFCKELEACNFFLNSWSCLVCYACMPHSMPQAHEMQPHCALRVPPCGTTRSLDLGSIQTCSTNILVLYHSITNFTNNAIQLKDQICSFSMLDLYAWCSIL